MEELATLITGPMPDSGIYFATANGLIKIGYSKQVRERLIQLSGSRVRPMAVLAVGACAARRVDVEILVHNEFRVEHVGHEWFRPSARLLLFIGGVLATGRIPAHLDRSRTGIRPMPVRLPEGDRRRTRRVVTSSATHGVPTDLPTAEVAP